MNENKVFPLKRRVQKWQLIPEPVTAWRAIYGLILALTICLIIFPRLAVPILPFGSLAVGYFLYQRYPALYIGFTWWTWFLGPFVKRLIDYRCNAITPWPYNMTPLLVTSISIISVIRYLPKNYKKDGLPFFLCFLSILYAFFIGLVRQQITDFDREIMVLLSWVSPISFGFHLFVNWRNYPQIRENIRQVFFWGVLIMGIYGVTQFLVAPAWDRFFIVNSGVTAVGVPEPLGIRVWSTMRTARTFSFTYAAGLILLLLNKSKLRYFAIGFGYLTFLLSESRTGWYVWAIALILFVISLKERQQIKSFITISLLALVVIPLATLQPFSSVISERFGTFSDLENDHSFNSRLGQFDSTIDRALSEYTGWGLIGAEGVPNAPSIGEKEAGIRSDSASSNDNGYLVLLVAFGLVAVIPYAVGLVLLMLNLFSGAAASADSFAVAARSIAFASVFRIITSNISMGEFAIPLWSFVGVAIAAKKYHSMKSNLHRFNGNSETSPTLN